MPIENNEQWMNFIAEYKNLRELWDKKYKKYRNQAIREAAYEKLTEVYKNIEQDATLEKVKKRIKNMRFAYRRALRKKMASERRSGGVGAVYEPNLWYFNALDFLKEYQMVDDATTSEDEKATINHLKSLKRRKISESYESKELMKKVEIPNNNMNTVKQRDEADIYGECWAHSYRKLSDTQKLFAKKACDEIFILGQLGKLTLNSVRPEMPQYPSPVSYRSSSCNSVPPGSVQDVLNIQSTPVHIKQSPSHETNCEEVAASSDRTTTTIKFTIPAIYSGF